MRILQVCNKPPFPVNDGGSLAMFNLARALQTAGNQVEVLTMVTDKHPLSADSAREFSEIMPLTAVFVDTRISPAGMLFNLLFSKKPYNATRFISKEFTLQLKKLVSLNQFDIIQLEGLYLLPYVNTIRENCSSLIAFRAHNVEHEIWERISRQEKNTIKKLYFRILAKRIRLFEKSFVNAYDLLVPITWRDEKKFTEMGNRKPSLVCQPGFDVLDITHTNHQVPSLYFLGSLDWIPNQEGLIWFVNHVFPLLRKQYTHLTFHVAGRNAPAHLIRKIASHGIFFYDEVENARDFVMKHDVLVAPCFSGGGMRIKIVEAMSLGKTVLTTTLGAEGIPVKHNVNILIADTADEFVDAVDRLMKYSQLYRDIGSEALKFVQLNYSNINIAATLVGFYKHYLK